MRTIHLTPAVVGLVAALAVGCAAQVASSPAATAAAVPFASSPGAVAAASIAPATPTAPGPSPSPAASVTPVGPAHVTGTLTSKETATGDTTSDGDVSHLRGIVVESAMTTTDPRVSGTTTVHLSVDSVGTFGWQWGDATLVTGGGTWVGPCKGAGWDSGNSSDMACWLAGTGAHQGLTYYLHLSTSGVAGELEGMILPIAAPAP